MKLKAHKLATSAALAMIILYSFTTLIVLVCTGLALDWGLSLFYLKGLGPLEPYVGVDSAMYAKGILICAVLTYGAVFITCSLYNKLSKQ